jgi:NAD(P)-dependent dehydrogenase (short-subunit alcohol dehydrogenase family)
MRTVVMTGATSGLGAVAARHITQSSETRLVAGSRGNPVNGAEVETLDLSELASTRTFAENVCARLGDTQIDVLVLNAGIGAPGGSPATADGYESVFATNHLAHYLLLRLLAPQLSPTATVILTTSDAHDPRINRLAPPRHAYADLLATAHQVGETNASAFRSVFRAYATSKLCNLLTARAFARICEAKGNHIRVVAYNPGFTPETGLNRDTIPAARALIRGVAFLARRFIPVNTVEEAGRSLADLALGQVPAPDGRIYASLVRGELTWPDTSVLAHSDDAMISLWQDSAGLVGLESRADASHRWPEEFETKTR